MKNENIDDTYEYDNIFGNDMKDEGIEETVEDNVDDKIYKSFGEGMKDGDMNETLEVMKPLHKWWRVPNYYQLP